MIYKTLLLILVACLLMNSQTSKAIPVKKEFKVKAGLIFNFANFTRWPKNSFKHKTSVYVVCIAGEDPYSAIFETTGTQTIHGRNLKTLKINANADMLSLAQCHILFVRLTDDVSREALLSKSRSFPVLTISETHPSQSTSSMINFINKNDNVTFTINRTAAKQVGIGFSSKMLRLAHRVTGGKS